MGNEERAQSRAVAAAYDRGAAGYVQSWKEPHPWMAEARAEFGARVSSGMTLLDVGCGPGHDSNYWSEKGLKTLGIDLSQKTIDIAKSNYPKLNFQVMDILDLGVLKQKFDSIWMAYSLLHITKAAAADVIDLVRGHLKPNGVFFVETSIAEQTEEAPRPIKGLNDESGREIEVPYTIWSGEELEHLLSAAFLVEWSKRYDPLKGRTQIWSAVMRCR